MSTSQERISNLQTALTALQTSVLQMVQTRKAPSAFEAGDAATLNGQTATQVTAVMTNAVQAHINNHNNPHGLAPSDIGTYSKEQLDTLLSGYMANGGNFPVSAFGTGAVDTAIGATVNSGQNTITIPAIQAIMVGRLINLPQTNVALNANATTDLYLELINGQPSYSAVLSIDTQPAESDTVMYIGSAETVNNTHTIRNVLRIGQYRISTTAIGSAIPVSTGYPAQTGHLAWT